MIPDELYIETEMHDISILHNIFLTFDAHLSGLFNSSLGAISDIILVLDHLGTDKSFLEVRMDNTGALRSFPAFMERPRTTFVRSGGQEGLQVQ